MKKRPGKKIKAAAVFLTGAVLSLLFLKLGWDQLKEKERVLADFQSVGLAVDWDDIRLSGLPQEESLAIVLQAGVNDLIVPIGAASDEVKLIRNSGVRVIWKGEPPFDQNNPSLEYSDGLMPEDDKAWGYDGGLGAAASIVADRDLFLPKVEFAPVKGFSELAKKSNGPVVKTHCLQSKETVEFLPGRWLARFHRAARERAVRLFYYQFSPHLGFADNVSFLETLSLSRSAWGFKPGEPSFFPNWTPHLNPTFPLLAGVWSVLIPVFCAYVLAARQWQSPFLGVMTAALLAVLGGIGIHALLSTRDVVLGLELIRGVKLQLAGPLIFSLPFLVSKADFKRAVQSPHKGKTIFWVGVGAALFLGVYLMRSGNFPVLPVPEWERDFRDWLDSTFIARPRFKEFLIGYPLLFLGLFLRRRGGSENFFKDGRLFILMGLVGPISVVNTFLHVHTPLSLSLIRTGHGLLLGLPIGVLLCALASWFLDRNGKLRPGAA